MASISGEVVKPGSYPVAHGMTLQKFIESAGGLNERAYPKECEIIRYYIKNGERKKKVINLPLNKTKTFIVQKYDQINIKRIPYWYEKKQVTLKGEVKFPGTYVIHSGEKLSSVIERAGGFTDEAFLYGAIFTRKEIAVLQKKSLARSLSKLKEQVILASLRASGSKTMGQISVKEGIQAVQSLIDEAEKLTPIGRISINLTCNLESFKNSPSDLTLKDGDTLTIPSHNDTVIVSGEVMNPMALTYMGDNIRQYINRTGGLTEIADADHIYVLHANGEAQKASLGSYLFSSNNVNVKKGDVIIIPKKIMFERGIDIAGDIADIVYKLTLTVAAMNTVGVL
jgi:protein involved in polysaccharide export with SLBB domain